MGYAIAALLGYFFYRAEARLLGRSRALAVVILLFLLTIFVNEVHHYGIDQSSSYFHTTTNLAWQEAVQNAVVHLDPGVAPHSYRFLPNAIVFWMQIGRVRFDVARDIYRLLTGFLLFYSIWRYALLFTDYLGGIVTVLLVSAVYPISFEWYAGQLTDPLSHLSFVLAFIFLETGNFPFLLTTLLLGSLAKETVLALCGFYILFCHKERNYALKALALTVASLAMYFGVRFFVLHGSMHYQQISGVSLQHVIDNWKSPNWPWLFLITAAAYVPFLVLGWKDTPASLKRMALYLVPVLFTSSLFFSWLSESRNWMPLVFVLAVAAARYFNSRREW